MSIVTDAVCPSCRSALSKFPGRKTKCPLCSQFVYVRTDPQTRNRVLCDEEGIIEIEALWLKENEGSMFYGILKSAGIAEEQVEAVRARLRKSFGAEPMPRDVAWGVLNNAIAVEKDLRKSSQLQWHLAQIAYQNGEPFQHLLKAASIIRNRDKYRQMKEAGIEFVSLATCGCRECRRYEGKIFPVSQLIDDQILPHSDCSNSYGNYGPGWCTCLYVAEVDFEDLPKPKRNINSMSLTDEEKQRIEEEEAYRAEVRGKVEVRSTRAAGKYEAVGALLIIAGLAMLFISGGSGGALIGIGFVVFLVGRFM